MKNAVLITDIASLRAEIAGKNIPDVGFVPTMGALHRGHVALIEAARAHNELVIVSIFVNPLQFGPGEDWLEYPRDLEADRSTAAGAGADIVFAPDAGELLGDSILTTVSVEDLDRPLCGASRPGHFQGVATIVAKFFNIVGPCTAYFGAKDWQQVLIVKKLCADLNFPVDITVVPTVRDPDGLAVSSRNKYLSQEERRAALALPGALESAEKAIRAGETDGGKVSKLVREMIAAEPGVKLEYFSICVPDSLDAVDRVRGNILLAAAVHVGDTRLIDNRMIEL